MKKKDWIVIVVLALFICGGYFFYQMTQGNQSNQSDQHLAEIYYQNKVIQTVDLSVDDVYTIKGSYGSFSLEVKDGKYHAVHVKCPNHDCEKVGWIKIGSNKQIVCVPNEIYVVQKGVEDQVQ